MGDVGLDDTQPEVNQGLPGQVQCTTCALHLCATDAFLCYRSRNRFKCRSCNRLQTRIYRMKRKYSMQVSFSNRAAKEDFFQKHSAAYGSDLKDALELVTSEGACWLAGGRLAGWLDEEAITERWASKPKLLNTLLQHAPRMEHPVTKNTLYFDLANIKEPCRQKPLKPPSRKLMHDLDAAVRRADRKIASIAKLVDAVKQADLMPPNAFITLESKQTDLQNAVAKACLALKTPGWLHLGCNRPQLKRRIGKCSKALTDASKVFRALVKWMARANKVARGTARNSLMTF